MKSPYKEAMALLTASAATEAGLQNLMARLSTEKNRWSLGKEALVVDGYGGASSYQFTVSTALTQNAEKPSFADVIVQNREPMTLLLVGMGCMLVLLLAAVLLLVRIHHRKESTTISNLIFGEAEEGDKGSCCSTPSNFCCFSR